MNKVTAESSYLLFKTLKSEINFSGLKEGMSAGLVAISFETLVNFFLVLWQNNAHSMKKKCQVYSDFTVTLWALRITLCGFNIFVIPKLFNSKNYIELLSKLNTRGQKLDCVTTLL